MEKTLSTCKGKGIPNITTQKLNWTDKITSLFCYIFNWDILKDLYIFQITKQKLFLTKKFVILNFN